jgi:DNA-binding XRE family transcriptional regulator
MQAFLTSSQLADRLGVDRTTISRRIEAGSLRPAAKLPGKTGAWLFDPDNYQPKSTEQTPP